MCPFSQLKGFSRIFSDGGHSMNTCNSKAIECQLTCSNSKTANVSLTGVMALEVAFTQFN